MFTPQRFLAFLGRFWPLWAVWLVVAVVPATREVLRLHTVGSPLVSLYEQPWRLSFGRGLEFDAFKRVKAHPHDLNARLWRFKQWIYGMDEDSDSKTYSSKSLLREANAIRHEFPSERWLVALPVMVIDLRMNGWNSLQPTYGNLPLVPAKLARELTAYTRLGARLEPQNAYYPFIEAKLGRLSRNEASVWENLNRAARCTVYDSHELEFANGIIAAHEAIHPLCFEEKDSIWKQHYQSASSGNDNGLLNLLSEQGAVAHSRGDHRRCIAIGALLARVGDLLQRGKNNNSIAAYGSQLKSAAWRLQSVGKRQPRAYARGFADYAAAHGRADVARMVPGWAQRQREIASFQQGTQHAMEAAGWWRDAGGMVLLNALYVAAFWLAANLFLWGGQGPPSSLRERVWPAVLVACFTVSIAWWPVRFFQNVNYGRWSPVLMSHEIAAGCIAMLAFFGPPFLMAVLCAAATLWSQKRQFLRTGRIEQELQLGRAENTLLKSGAGILCTVSLIGSFGCWVAWLVLLKSGVRTFDPLGWLPDDGKIFPLSRPVPPEAMAVPLGYFLVLNLVGFLLWFIKWRYFCGAENRPLTHAGLRRWKEALGVYVVLVSVVYLGVGLCGWPSRAAANRELESRMRFGELPR